MVYFIGDKAKFIEEEVYCSSPERCIFSFQTYTPEAFGAVIQRQEAIEEFLNAML